MHKKTIAFIIACMILIALIIVTFFIIIKALSKPVPEQVEEIPNPYEDLMETFQTAILWQWNPARLEEYGIGPEPYVGSFLPANYGYQHRDITGDGVEEMIVGYELEDITLVTEIYTAIDGKPEKIFASGIRRRVDIYPDNTIIEKEIVSPGTGEQGYEIYTIDANGEKQIKAGYIYDIINDLYKDINNPKQKLTEAEVKKLKRTEESRVKISLTPFAPEALSSNTEKENDSKDLD